MEKHKLLALVKRTADYFDDYKNPTAIYNSLWNDVYLKQLVNKLSAEDIVFFCFLVPVYLKGGQDIDETYDRIETNMYSVELVEIYNTEPEVDCPDCHNGQEPCEYCDGTGETECYRCNGDGEEDCDYCGGSGVDEEGNECDMCEGSGRMTCGKCNGSGEESCNYCGGDGETNCYNCDATGNIYSNEQVEVQYLDYISWSSNWKGYFFDKKADQQLDSEDARNFHHNSQTIYLGMYQEITEDYTGYDNDDMLLYVAKDTKDLNLRKHSDRVYP